MRLAFLLLLFSSSILFGEKPNIVILLSDDLGYGEIQHLNPDRGKIPTPHLDAIARSGMTFTDGHSTSSVCTPTRYSLLTGRYSWRTWLQKGVVKGGPSLFSSDRLTLAKFLSQNGYHTAVFGKWHLGMLFNHKKDLTQPPLGSTVTEGPLDKGGFHEFEGFHHARQMNLWIKNDTVTDHLKPIEFLPKITKSAIDYIHRRKDQAQPFFLYLPWNSPHSPVVPTDEWQGKSSLNSHADFVMQTDHCHGQIIAALRETGQLNNTLLFVTTDNGTSAPTSKIDQLHKLGHYPSAHLRGSKADIWDGGHRVPFFLSWPGVIKPGSTSNQLVGQIDFLATIADLLNVELPPHAAEDSISFLPHLKNEKHPNPRNSLIHHSSTGQFAIRHNHHKLILCPGSGGWTTPRTETALESGPPYHQLYDLATDPSEQNNLISKHPDLAQQLQTLLQTTVTNGRTTPGPPHKNDAKITLEKWRSQIPPLSSSQR
ncbi:MAG: arylsulfatase [Verrucomicrobiota bacterium]